MVKSKILSKYPNLLHFFGDKNSSLDLENIIAAEQIHGNKVAVLDNSKNKFIKGADGMVTNKLLTLSIRTADCLPIFFYSPKEKIIAAIHAGWKGLASGIIENAVLQIRKLGANLSDVKVAIGPHIQVCCYKVLSSRIAKFNNSFGEFRVNSWYLNLSKIALLQLKSLGILPSNIENSNICTSCDKRFFSFRREGAKTGRLINIIELT